MITGSRGLRTFNTKLVLQRGGSPGGEIIFYGRGRGLGSFLSKSFSFLSPYILPLLKSLGSEVLKRGADVVENIGGEKNLKELIQEQKQKGLQNLKSKAMNTITSRLKGSGIKRRRRRTRLTVVRKPSTRTRRRRARKSTVKKSTKRRRGRRGRKAITNEQDLLFP